MLEHGGAATVADDAGILVACPYQPFEVLGRGGMGMVHRARHEVTGEVVALKTVAAPRAGAFAALRREVAALQRISHPGVIRVIDEGVSRGQPWYAMELLPGRTLRDSLRGEPMPLAEALTLAARIAWCLDSIHTAGFVHRDLTPSNVFLRDPRTPVLADFGLATRFDGALGREVLDAGGHHTGTPSYVSPEQVRGALSDARADLYALGCILYEMLTGSPPFEGPIMSVLWAHAVTRPDPPSSKRAGLPKPVDDLVLRLLAKDPRDRYGYAGDVVSELAGHGADIETRVGPVYLYRPEMVGRDEVLSRVTARVDEVASGGGRAVFVVGESGVGKTRLALEVARRAGERGLVVVESTCEGGHAEAGLPVAPPLCAFIPFLRAVLDRCLQHGANESDRLLGPGAALLASFEPSLRAAPGYSGEAPAPLGADAAVKRLQSVLGSTLRAFAESKPLLLILDDLQWADELSLAALTALLGDPGRVMVLGLCRTSEASPELLELMGRAPEGKIALDRLDAHAVESMVADMLATQSPPPELSEFLQAESEGNAFFVVEYLRAAVEADLLSRIGGRWTYRSPGEGEPLRPGALGVPRPLREALHGRLVRLPAAARQVAESAAVLGREAPLDVLGEMLGGGDLSSALAELLARQIIEPRGDGAVRFSHDRLREHVYRDLPAGARQVWHARAARALEATLSDAAAVSSRAADLANHWEQSGRFDLAWPYLTRAGERSLLGGAVREGAERLERAHDLARRPDVAASGRELAHVERLLGQARHHLGDLQGMMRVCHSALARVAALDGRAVAVREASTRPAGARLWLETGRLAARELARIGGAARTDVAVGRARDAVEDAALAAEQLSNGYFFQQDPAGTLWAALVAARFASRLEPCAALARIHATLAVAWSSVPLRPVTVAYLASAGVAVRESRDPGAATVVELFAGLIALGDGSLDVAEEKLSRAEGIARAHHDGRRAREALALQGNVAYWRGRIGQALARYERLQDVARREGDDQALAWSHSGIVGCWMASGRDEEALALFRDSTVLSSAALGRSEGLANGNLAEAYLHLQRYDEALAFAEAHFARFEHEPAVGFPGIYGWSGTFDAFAEACARSPLGSARWRHCYARAAVCAAHVAQHARAFRVGRPAAARCAGTLLRLVGSTSLAVAAFEQSRALAGSIGAGADEARGCVEVARLLQWGDRRRRALHRAEVLFQGESPGYWRRQAMELERRQGWSR